MENGQLIMARNVHHLHQPRDYPLPDDHDPTGYYARKEIHRAEMLPYVGACIVAAVACVVVAFVLSLFS